MRFMFLVLFFIFVPVMASSASDLSRRAVLRSEIKMSCVRALLASIVELEEIQKKHETVRSIDSFEKVTCVDDAGYVKISIEGPPNPQIRDGAHYFMVAKRDWKIIEKWISGVGGWIDPEYEERRRGEKKRQERLVPSERQGTE